MSEVMPFKLSSKPKSSTKETGNESVSTEKFDNGIIKDLILDVQYLVLDAILELFWRRR